VVRQVELSFADPRRSSTTSFARDALELSRCMMMRDVALHLGISGDVIKDIEKRDHARRFAKPKSSTGAAALSTRSPFARGTGTGR
jgi:transposase